jgi:hypothetical protein
MSRPGGTARAAGTRLRDAMPRPLMVVFAFGAIVALVASTVALLRPPTPAVPLQDRRPPPRVPRSHDVGAIAPAPVPSVAPDVVPPCVEVSGVRILGGGAAVGRLRAVLERVCTLAGGGVSPDLARAVAALSQPTELRFGGFDVTGVESTLDRAPGATPTIWLNIKLSLRSTPAADLAPILLHEAWHRAHPTYAIGAADELAARRVEVEVCRLLVAIDRWPRWCRDARGLTTLPEPRALELLRSAGYA